MVSAGGCAGFAEPFDAGCDDAGTQSQAATVRRLLAAHARSEDLVRIGAYKAGPMRNWIGRCRRCLCCASFLSREAMSA